MGLNDEENGIWTGSLRESGGTERKGTSSLASDTTVLTASGSIGPSPSRYAYLESAPTQTANLQWPPLGPTETLSFKARQRTGVIPGGDGYISLWDARQEGAADAQLMLQWDDTESGIIYLHVYIAEDPSNYINNIYSLDTGSNLDEWVDCSFSISISTNEISVVGMSLVSSDSAGNPTWPTAPAWGMVFFLGSGYGPNLDIRDLTVAHGSTVTGLYKFDETEGTVAVNSAPEGDYHLYNMAGLNVIWTPE